MNKSDIQQKNQQNDEIDIFEFCSRIWIAFKGLISSIKDIITSMIIFLIRKSLWIISFALVGIILGYLYYSISKPVYTSSLEGDTVGLDNSIIINHVNKLKPLNNKPALLAKYLNITEEQTEDINSIEAYYGIDVNRDGRPDYIDFKNIYNPLDTNQRRVPSYVYIKVTVHDENILPILRKGLLQYINTNPYLKELYRINRIQTTQLIGEITTEIHKIDSLQRSRFRKGIPNAAEIYPNTIQMYLGDNEKIRPLHQDILDLYRQKQILERGLEISDEIIAIVQDFTPLSKEENTLLHYILYSGAIMATLGLLCALLWQYRKRIWVLIKEDSTKR